MAPAPAATAARPCAGPAARLLAALLAAAVLVAVAPRWVVAAAPVAAVPAGEESETEVESASSACPRRSVALTGHAAADLPAVAPVYRLRPAPPGPVPDAPSAHVPRGPLRPHPRC